MFEAVRRLFSSPPAATAAPAADWRKQGNDFLARGELGEAIRCYRQAAEADADDAAARLSLGYALLEQQAYAEARQWLQEVVRLQPDQHEAHFLLGRVARARGELEAAEQSYARALQHQPGFELAQAEWAHVAAGIGQKLLDDGKAQDARDWFQRAAARRPGDAAAHANLGVALEALGDTAGAEASYQRALALQPAQPQALFGLGNLALQRHDAAGAAAHYAKVVAQAPDHPLARVSLAHALVDIGSYEEAAQHFRRVLEQRPGDAAALLGHANCLLGLDRHAEALAAYNHAITVMPGAAQAHLNRGNALLGLQREEEALQAFRHAAQLRPGYVEALVNIGSVLQARNRFDEAIAAYEQALAQDPSNAAAHWNRGLCLLVQGRLAAGWQENEWRWQALGRSHLPFAQPQWTGEQDVAGKTVLLHAEQGLGDTIQFARYVPLLAARGARVLLGVQPALEGVLRTLPGAFELLDDEAPVPPFDFHCPLMSLPLAFGTTVDTIPSQVPYLAARPELVTAWRERLAGAGRKQVGLVWSGNAAHVNDRNRSVPLALLAPLADTGVRLVSLHKEVRAADAAVLAASPIAHHGELLTDFEQTAALIACLDVVLTVDTSVAHLAGALGKPVWLLLPFSPDWRWLLERQDSPWYPTARLFRQPRAGDWAPVMQNVRDAIVRLVSGG